MQHTVQALLSRVDESAAKPRRWRVRYSLRTLLIFMLLFSAALALREGWSRPPWQVNHVLKSHKNWILSAAFSPDGRRIVTAGWDDTARVWDSETGRELHVLKGHNSVNCSATFSPDGRHIVTASHDETARVWDGETGHELHVLSGHESGVISATFSPDGRRIVTASIDGTARLWEAKTGRELDVLKGHKGRVSSAAFSPDGHRIITVSFDRTVRVWRRVRPERWWGVFWLPQFWAAVLLAAAFAWSLRRDYRRLMRDQPS